MDEPNMPQDLAAEHVSLKLPYNCSLEKNVVSCDWIVGVSVKMCNTNRDLI